MMRAVFIVMSLCCLISCKKALDATPDGRISYDDVFQDKEKVKAMFNTCFDNLPLKGLNYFFFANNPVGLSDESWYTRTDGPLADAYNGSVTAANNSLEMTGVLGFPWDGDYWASYFKQIRRINLFLQNIGQAKVESEKEREWWTAEAHLLRAFFYMELIKWYGPVPLTTSVMQVGDDYSKIKKASYADICRQIVADCDVALASQNLPWRLIDGNQQKRMTKGIAAALRGQAALYAASPANNNGENLWEWAYQVNKESVALLEQNGYQLYTDYQVGGNYSSAYQEYFAQNPDYSATPNDKETIMENFRASMDFFDIQTLPILGGSFAGNVPTQELIDAYDMAATGKPVLDPVKPYLDEQHLQPNYLPGSGYDPQKPYEGRDPRFYASTFYNGSTYIVAGYGSDNIAPIETFVGGNCGLNLNNAKHTHTGYYSRKSYFTLYWPAVFRFADGKPRFFRLGRSFLDLAECAAETGRVQEAMDYVNKIRRRAGFAPAVDKVAASAEEARRIVRSERRVELAYEEARYFDVRRWTPRDQDMKEEKFVTGMRITKNTDGSFKYERFVLGPGNGAPSKSNYQKKWHFYPIPQKEVIKLEAATGEVWQNKGW
ncbi:RagB/SusD family nutrient uptake outer membrane protein [Niabella drilacis]|uniref:Starch-binding associating with outer membrane n=1 Tax=Niabella drilacis (strain DSM 25811 / CCM 8410 / CCUG 62505 / LMG 26954 / E90) TaxID=1285928 RepID=A0A1G6JG16_NIADE|nr:RagB/SusD family nutrient uptake outer membrane protein [Niabella drilacis]SDC17679.1 Starch-binding associating with outer membrane [Niabella drilacis]